MLFSKQLPLARVIDLCRAMRHNLAAGITLRALFKQQAERGPRETRALASRVAHCVEQGESLTAALEKERDLLPPLFLSLIRVGEETGNVPEVAAELEKYFLLQQKLRREFYSRAMMPAIQFVLALLIIAGLITVLGMIGDARPGSKPITLFGLSGPKGGLIFLVLSFGGIVLLFAAYRLLPRLFGGKEHVDAWLLRLPSIGTCLYAFVMSRFTMAFHLTLETGMSIMRALGLSLHATGNASFAAKADTVSQAIRDGESVFDALSRARIFSVEFLNIVAVGEESGRLAEVMQKQNEYWNEEAGRKLTVLTRLATMGVWLIYAIFMVVMIFRIATIYLSALGV